MPPSHMSQQFVALDMATNHCLIFKAGAAVPALPTLALVFLTAPRLSVLRLSGLERLTTLRLPEPLPLLVLMGVLATDSPLGIFHSVFVVVVVTQLTARFLLLATGEREDLRASMRS